jgi:hypothetical protein
MITLLSATARQLSGLWTMKRIVASRGEGRKIDIRFSGPAQRRSRGCDRVQSFGAATATRRWARHRRSANGGRAECKALIPVEVRWTAPRLTTFAAAQSSPRRRPLAAGVPNPPLGFDGIAC